MNAPRLSREERAPEQSQDRALVANLTAVKIFLGVLITAATLLVSTGIWVGRTVSSLEQRVTTLEGRRPERDAQINGLSVRIDGIDARLRPVEIGNASMPRDVAALKELTESGFQEIGRRLDRIEDSAGRSKP